MSKDNDNFKETQKDKNEESNSFYPWIKKNSKCHSLKGMLKLHYEILDFYDFIKLNKEEIKSRNKTLKEISNIIEDNFTNYQCKLYGSFLYELSLPNSDIDILIIEKNHQKEISAKKDENTIYKNGLEDYIEITGFKENPYPYIAFSDIYVQPSYEESQGLAIYEALVLGKAVVSTDTIGGRCTLDFGNKGIITDISAEALADGIKKLIDNEELLCSYENRITLEDNLREKQVYFEKWKKLLDGEY